MKKKNQTKQNLKTIKLYKGNRSLHLSQVVLFALADGRQNVNPFPSPAFRKTFLRCPRPFVRKYLYSWKEMAKIIMNAKRFAQQNNTITQ